MSTSNSSRGDDAIVYIDSPVEQEAWLIATFGPTGQWSIASQTWRTTDMGKQQEMLEIALPSGEHVEVTFAEASPDESLAGEGQDRTGKMEELMQRALEFSEANPPHHPGTLPRFPVPSASYRDTIAVPMTVLAVDDAGARGLYAPPRQVGISIKDGSLVGAGEFPGFDPEHWPPARLGDWPPPQVAGIPPVQLQAMIARFSACWSRVLDAWFAKVAEADDILRQDVREGLHRRSMLDLMEMLQYYDRLNPVFAKWLNDMVGEDHHDEETR